MKLSDQVLLVLVVDSFLGMIPLFVEYRGALETHRKYVDDGLCDLNKHKKYT